MIGIPRYHIGSHEEIRVKPVGTIGDHARGISSESIGGLEAVRMPAKRVSRETVGSREIRGSDFRPAGVGAGIEVICLGVEASRESK